MVSVIEEVVAERRRQDEKWGEQNHPDGPGYAAEYSYYYGPRAEVERKQNDVLARKGRLHWAGILLEEVYEALAESDPAKLREELIQVAAVAVAWVECIDRRAIPYEVVAVNADYDVECSHCPAAYDGEGCCR